MEQDATNPFYTGGSGALENIFKKLLHCATINDQGTVPRIFKRGGDVREHIRRTTDYVKSVDLDERGRCAFIINSLEEGLQYELFSYVDYASNSNNYSWICDKLVSMLSEKISSAGPLMRLLKIKQNSDQKVRDFEREIRINAVKVMGINSDAAQREQFMITAFINGLFNRRAAIALKELNPKTLEECYMLVKKETSQDSNGQESDLCALGSGGDKAVIQSLVSQIRHLQNQVNFLLSKFSTPEKSTAKPSYADVLKQNSFQQRPLNIQQKPYTHLGQTKPDTRTCYNCGKPGHIARFCSNTPVCSKCKTVGHNSRFCNRRLGPQHVRRYFEERASEDAMRDNTSTIESVNSKINDAVETSVCTMTASNICKPAPFQRSKLNVTKGFNEVDQWVEYIKGNARKPKMSTPTLISSSRPERAANKPLVHGIIEGKPTKIFFDTGAELNVVDETFVNELKSKKPELRIDRVNSTIRCANDSRMKALGRIKLDLTIDGIKMPQEFTIVQGIFPKVIVGIRQMKKCNISVDPSNDSIWISSHRVPFVSKIVPAYEQKNARQLVRRA